MTTIPWTGKNFAARHNKKLKGPAAAKAAAQANAVLRSGVPEGEAIAIANKHAKKHVAKLRERGLITDRAHDRWASRK